MIYLVEWKTFENFSRLPKPEGFEQIEELVDDILTPIGDNGISWGS